jgi:hypothetical protein
VRVGKERHSVVAAWKFHVVAVGYETNMDWGSDMLWKGDDIGTGRIVVWLLGIALVTL